MNPYAILAALVLVIAAGLGGYRHGRHVEAGEQAEEQLRQALAYADEIKRRQRAADTLAAELDAARAAQRPKDRIIIKEVVRYESMVPADRRCDLDGAWRLLHDAAATGQPADPARLAAPAADRVADAAALETVAENYADCREWRAWLIGWQRWWAIARP